MVYNLDNILENGFSDVVGGLDGLKILFYGGNTNGKSPQAMKFPKPYLVMGESGGSAIRGFKHPMFKKSDFTNLVKDLTDSKKMDKYKDKIQTIVIDCVEDIIDLYKDHLCKQFGVDDVGQIQKLEKGNPNGYTMYRSQFKNTINSLTSCGYTVIFISHEEIEEIENENGEVIKRWIVPKGSSNAKDSTRFIRDLCDFRFYIKNNGIDEETNRPIMSTAYCVQTKDFYAGSRYEGMPTYINPFTAENIINAIEKVQKENAEMQGGIVKEFKIDTNKFTRDDYLSVIKPYVSKLALNFKYEVQDIVYSQLGEGVKLNQATEDNLVQLEVIYTNLIQLACDRGIYI